MARLTWKPEGTEPVDVTHICHPSRTQKNLERWKAELVGQTEVIEPSTVSNLISRGV